jgi:hypothetical protein
MTRGLAGLHARVRTSGALINLVTSGRGEPVLLLHEPARARREHDLKDLGYFDGRNCARDGILPADGLLRQDRRRLFGGGVLATS